MVALSKLSGDEQRIICGQLCNVLEPRLAVYLSSASKELREPTQALLQQLRADHEAAAALCVKLGLRDCKALRKTWWAWWEEKRLSATDLATLGSLPGSLLLVSELRLAELTGTEGPDGVQRLAEGLGAGALPAVSRFTLNMHVGDAGAVALAAALGRGALPRLKSLRLCYTAIGDAGLVALAPVLRQLPALEDLLFMHNPLGDEGIAALVAPPLPAGAPPTTTGVLTKLKVLAFNSSQVSDASCAALVAALDSRTLPALDTICLHGTPASAAAKAAVEQALKEFAGRCFS